jgi:ABC-type branched-subunit amino acid transport system substrate-binding protein
VPFVPVVRDEAQAWGAAANATVELASKQGVWALIGGVEDANSHVVTRVLLKLEVPLVNTAGPDPTLTEHAIPWLVRTRTDDRRNCYRLARKVFEEDGRRRVAVFRSNDRYGRMGVKEFVDAARRLHHPVLIEVRFGANDSDWAARLARLRDARPDAILLWGKAEAAGQALRALRDAGLEQPVYGPDRLADARFLAAAGKAAEGTVFTYPFDPGSDREAWSSFRTRYRARFDEDPEAVAASAYDGTRYLVQAIREGGLNRVRIRDRLFAHATFEGVTGTIRFDPSHNNVAEVVLGRVAGGRLRFD